jgi:23S rRNA pseudouridine955/2504/2580 synthase
MHLHARRLKVDHPDGGVIDVIAELPKHFSDSLQHLGFEEGAGDRMVLDEVKAIDTPEGKRRLIANKAKDARKARRGERRGRNRE